MTNHISITGRKRLLLLLSPSAALSFPLLEAFGRMSIPVAAGPTLVLLSGIIGLGLALGIAAATLRPRVDSGLARRVLFTCVLTASLLATLDIAIGGHAILNAIVPDALADGSLRGLTRLASVMALAAASFGILWGLRAHAEMLLSIGAIAALATTLLINAFRPISATADVTSDVERTRTDAPLFVYIVLDEAMGISGLQSAPGGNATASALREILGRHDFRVYPNAFSRHFVSNRSIPNTINFDFSDNSYGAMLRHHTDLKLESRLFENLAEVGYEVVTYGTEHMDVCFSSASACTSLDSFNPLSEFITSDEVRSSALSHLIHDTFNESYLLYNYTQLLSSQSSVKLPSGLLWFDPFAFPQWFDAIAEDVLAAPRGRAYFIHLLMPHAPYIHSSGCDLTGRAEVSYFLQEQYQFAGAILDEERAKRYPAYLEQYGCLISKLDSLLTRLDTAPNFRDATIVLQGDHGSRISSGQFIEHLTDRDYVDNYSSLFAVRGPVVQPGEDHRQTSVQRLVAEYFSGEPLDSLGPDDRTVVVDSVEDGKVVVREMPSPDEGLPAD